jgi:hypothetical protein
MNLAYAQMKPEGRFSTIFLVGILRFFRAGHDLVQDVLSVSVPRGRGTRLSEMWQGMHLLPGGFGYALLFLHANSSSMSRRTVGAPF